MSNRAVDLDSYRDFIMGEIACCECGYHRNGAHHPKIQCPHTGRCGECGNDWPCDDHKLKPEPRRGAQLNFDRMAQKGSRNVVRTHRAHSPNG